MIDVQKGLYCIEVQCSAIYMSNSHLVLLLKITKEFGVFAPRTDEIAIIFSITFLNFVLRFI